MFSEMSPSNGLDFFFKSSYRNFHRNASRFFLFLWRSYGNIYHKNLPGFPLEIPLLTPHANIQKKIDFSLNNS